MIIGVILTDNASLYNMNSFIFKMFNKPDSDSVSLNLPGLLLSSDNVLQGQSTIVRPSSFLADELNEDILKEYDVLNPAAEESKSEDEGIDKMLDINSLPEYKRVEEQYLKNKEIINIAEIKEQFIKTLNTNPPSVNQSLLQVISAVDKKLIEVQMDQKEFFEARIIANKSLENYKKRTEALNNDLSETIRIERYNEADNIQKEVETIAEGINNTKEQLDNLNNIINSHQHKKIILQKQKKEILSVFMSTVNNWIRREESEISKHKANMELMIKEETKEIKIGEENIEKLEGILNEKKTEHDKKVQELDNIIIATCKELIEERSSLDKEIKVIDKEIEDLERILKEKKEYKSKKDKERSKVQQEIDLKKKNYRPEQNEIADIEKVLNNIKTDIEVLKIKTKKKKSNIENYEKTKSEELSRRNEILTQLNNFINEYSQQNYSIMAAISQVEQLNKELETAIERNNIIKEKISELETKEKAFNDQIAKNDWEIKDGMGQVASLTEQIVKLNENKKVLATAKKFKEASKASTDIKTFQSKVEELEKEIEVLKDNKEKWNEELRLVVEEIAKVRKEEEASGNEVAQIKYRKVNCSIAELEGLINNPELSESEIKILKDQMVTLKMDKKAMEERIHALLSRRHKGESVKEVKGESKVKLERSQEVEKKLGESEELKAGIKEQSTDNK